MEVTVETTVVEKTMAFKAWVVERICVSETFLSIAMHNLDYWLNQRKSVNDRLFNSKSQVVYFFTNNDMRDVERYCKKNGISDDVLADAIKEFKQNKSKVCKVKAENKQIFSELKEAIRLAIVYQLYRTRRMKNMKPYKLENNDTDFLRINALWDIYKKIIYRYKGSIYFDAYNNLNIPTEIIIQDINILETVRQELLTLFSSQHESFCRAFNSLIKTDIEELNRYLANNSCREDSVKCTMKK